MKTPSLILAGLLGAFAAATFGCGQADELHQRELEQLRRELADMRRTMDASGMRVDDLQKRVFLMNDEVETQRVRLMQRPPSVPNLPVVRAAPRQYGNAPAASSLSTKPPSRRSVEPDIAMPGSEALAFQTIDSAGVVRGEDGETMRTGRPASAPTAREQPAERYERYDRDEPLIRISDAPPLPVVKASPPPASAPTPAAFESRMGRADDQLPASLKQPSASRQRASDLPAPFEKRKAATTPVAASPAEPQAPHPPPPADTDPVVLYQESLDALRAGKHGQAVAGFRALVDRHPTNGLADNAIYWLGEADYDRQRYDEALSTFQQVLTSYPLGNKVPDAMLKIGLCFQNLGELPQAIAILRQLDEIYPDSDAARIARERLQAHAGASHP